MKAILVVLFAIVPMLVMFPLPVQASENVTAKPRSKGQKENK